MIFPYFPTIFLDKEGFSNALQSEHCFIIECPSCRPLFLDVLVFLNTFFLLAFYLEYKCKITWTTVIVADGIRFWILLAISW